MPSHCYLPIRVLTCLKHSFRNCKMSLSSNFIRRRYFPFVLIVRHSSTSYAKKRLRGYKFPEILASDCETKHIRGSGPGGSCVNAAGNAVFLRHKPTNCFVKVHESRKLVENQKIAQDRLKFAVDNHQNGQQSYEAQFQRIKREYEERARTSSERKRQSLAKCREIGDQLLSGGPKRREGAEDDDP